MAIVQYSDYSFAAVKSITVKEFKLIGKLNTFSCCGICEKKVMESEIRNHLFSCGSCKVSYRIDDLKANLVLPITIEADGSKLDLTVAKDVMDKILPNAEEGDIVDELFGMKDVTVKFDIHSLRIASIVQS